MSLRGMAAEKIVHMMLNAQILTLYVRLMQRIQLEDLEAIRDDGGTAWKETRFPWSRMTVPIFTVT